MQDICYNHFMRILLITDLYPVSEKERTTPRTLYDFVKGWEAAGHEVSVIKPNFILNSFIRKKPFYKTGQYGNVFNVNYFTPFMFNVENKLPEITTDLIIAHMPSGILFADKLDIPFVAGIHNSDIEVLTKPQYSFYFRARLEQALFRAPLIACRSFVLRDKLLRMYPQFRDKTFVAPSGIDARLIKPLREKNFGKTLKVLTCANFKKRKNIDKLIYALKGLEGFELTVIGDGDGRRELQKIDSSVKFTGALPHDEVMDKMSDADVFVLPSVGETFGMVYLEAMAAGCITVGTKADGIDGIIKDGENGFLVYPTVEDIRQTLLSIKNLNSDELKSLRCNTFNTINRYTSEACAEDYLDQIFKFL